MNQLEVFKQKYPEYNVIYLTQFGSRLYGTATATSDTDYKGLYIPSMEDVILKKDILTYKDCTSKEKNTKDDVDFELFSIYHFFDKLNSSETNAMSILFSMFRKDTIVFETSESNFIKKNYDKLLTFKIHSYLGYCLKQAQMYGLKGLRVKEIEDFRKNVYVFSEKIGNQKMENYWEELKRSVVASNYEYINYVIDKGANDTPREYLNVLGRKYDRTITFDYFIERLHEIEAQYGQRSRNASSGVDFKALSHSLRTMIEAKELMLNGFISYPLKDSPDILRVKQGMTPVEDVVQQIDDLIIEVNQIKREEVKVDYNPWIKIMMAQNVS